MIDVIEYLERSINGEVDAIKEELLRGNVTDLSQYRWLIGNANAYKVVLNNLADVRKQVEKGDE